MKDTVVSDATVAGRMFDDRLGGGLLQICQGRVPFEVITTSEMKPHTVRYSVAFSCFLCPVIGSGVARFI
jgi:hypothetical protein